MQYVFFFMNETMVISYGLKYQFFDTIFFEKKMVKIAKNGQKMAKNGKFWLEKGLNGLNLHFFENFFFDKNEQKWAKNGQNGQKGLILIQKCKNKPY